MYFNVVPGIVFFLTKIAIIILSKCFTCYCNVLLYMNLRGGRMEGGTLKTQHSNQKNSPCNMIELFTSRTINSESMIRIYN